MEVGIIFHFLQLKLKYQTKVVFPKQAREITSCSARSKLIQLYTLNMCSFWSINYTLSKAVKKKKKEKKYTKILTEVGFCGGRRYKDGLILVLSTFQYFPNFL